MNAAFLVFVVADGVKRPNGQLDAMRRLDFLDALVKVDKSTRSLARVNL